VNVIVIGAGIVGAAIAHELASRGAGVRLVDARGVGQGATAASAGILAPYIEGHHPPLLNLAICSLALYDEFVRRVEADSRCSVEYRRCGTLQVAGSEEEFAVLASAARGLEKAGVAHSLLDRRDVAQLEAGISPRAAGGLLVPSQGYVTAPALTQAVVHAALGRGALFAAAQVREIRCRRDRVEVIAGHEVFGGDAVVVAAGSWSSRIGTVSHDAIRPIRGQLLYLRAAPGTIARIVWGARCYLVPWQDGTILAGATVEDVGFDERSTVEGVSRLLDAAVDLVPALGRAELREVRVGLRPMIADELPAIGPSSTMPGVYYAIGHYRNGILLAPLTAVAVADLVLEGRQRPELALVRPARVGL
jgi:glycine oxidase